MHPSEPQSWLEPAEKIDLLADMLRLGEAVSVRVRGSCMRPWAAGGDLVRVEPIAGCIQSGEILLTRSHEGLFTHRVVAISADGCATTRGDLSDARDPAWSSADILGRVVSVETRWGFPLRLDRRVLCLIGLYAAPGLRAARRAWHWLRASC